MALARGETPAMVDDSVGIWPIHCLWRRCCRGAFGNTEPDRSNVETWFNEPHNRAANKTARLFLWHLHLALSNNTSSAVSHTRARTI